MGKVEPGQVDQLANLFWKVFDPVVVNIEHVEGGEVGDERGDLRDAVGGQDELL